MIVNARFRAGQTARHPASTVQMSNENEKLEVKAGGHALTGDALYYLGRNNTVDLMNTTVCTIKNQEPF